MIINKLSLPEKDIIICHAKENSDNYTVSIVRKTNIGNKRIGFFISWTTIMLTLVFIVVIGIVHLKHKEELQQYSELFNDSGNIYNNWIETGFLFPDSENRYLDEDDITMISQIKGFSKEDLIRYAVNEIYARNNYYFVTDKYYQFFNSYEWYNGYLSAEDAVSQFNEFEQKNISFLLKEEAECDK